MRVVEALWCTCQRVSTCHAPLPPCCHHKASPRHHLHEAIPNTLPPSHKTRHGCCAAHMLSQPTTNTLLNTQLHIDNYTHRGVGCTSPPPLGACRHGARLGGQQPACRTGCSVGGCMRAQQLVSKCGVCVCTTTRSHAAAGGGASVGLGHRVCGCDNCLCLTFCPKRASRIRSSICDVCAVLAARCGAV